MEVLIRPATPQDVPVIAEIERKCFSDPWSEKDFQDCVDFDFYRFLSAEAQGEIVGYAAYFRAAEVADIANIAVRPDCRREGIGRKLLTALLEAGEADGVENFFLEVREANEAAIRLYESQGFKAVGLRKDYYRDPVENAILMKYERS